MLNKLLTLLLIFAGIEAFSQSTIAVANRETILLDGKWKYIVDPMENGYYNYRYQVNPNGFFKDQKMGINPNTCGESINSLILIFKKKDWTHRRGSYFFRKVY